VFLLSPGCFEGFFLDWEERETGPCAASRTTGFAIRFNDRDATDTRSESGARFDRVLAAYTNAVTDLVTKRDFLEMEKGRL
jgi:hypothetical protein